MIRQRVIAVGFKDMGAIILGEIFEQALQDRRGMPKNTGEWEEEVHFRYFEPSIPKA